MKWMPQKYPVQKLVTTHNWSQNYNPLIHKLSIGQSGQLDLSFGVTALEQQWMGPLGLADMWALFLTWGLPTSSSTTSHRESCALSTKKHHTRMGKWLKLQHTAAKHNKNGHSRPENSFWIPPKHSTTSTHFQIWRHCIKYI
jgi:hypothetical protein